jgi:hypothetical protein
MSSSIRASVQQFSPLGRPTEFAEPPLLKQSAFLVETGNGELVTCSSVCVRLDLEDLSCFTTVERQYEQWGVLFNNAVALRPSNPAYPPRSGMTVLLGAPKSGWIEATFLHPVQYVSSFVTSSRCTVMSAFNHQNQLVAQTESLAANLKNGSTHGNLRLSLNAANIYRVTLHSFNGQLTVDDFCFCGT